MEWNMKLFLKSLMANVVIGCKNIVLSLFPQWFEQNTYCVNCHFSLINFPKILYKLCWPCFTFRMTDFIWLVLQHTQFIFKIYFERKNALYELEGVTGGKNKHPKPNIKLYIKQVLDRLGVKQYNTLCVH